MQRPGLTGEAAAPGSRVNWRYLRCMAQFEFRPIDLCKLISARWKYAGQNRAVEGAGNRT